MANTKSLEKILEFIRNQKKPVTKNKIVVECALPSNSVQDCLKLLQDLGKIEIVTNGKIQLIRKKRVVAKRENAKTN